MASNKPEQKFRCGGVECAIWKNTTQINGQDRQTYSVQIQRTYKDNDGNWKETNSYHPNDLPKVILAAQKSYEWITLKNGGNSEQTTTETSDTIPEQNIH